MNTYWNFPAATGGLINSINNAGLETFRGNALDSLTREICQNSLDAIKDKNKPVVVEFKSFSTPINRFPNKNELNEVFNLCQQTWEGHNKKSEEFIKNALSILDSKEIKFLRISDFNTKGLEGAKEGELGSPWSSLVKEAGSSNKDESSGGSFGIGKSAPFLNSNLRTLFYSSFDTTGYKSHIGVANIMSFKKGDNKTTLGNGYYTHNTISSAIPGLLYLDEEFRREEAGTDIYVSAFEPKENWEEEVKNSVLFNFFITIFKKNLIVKVNEFEINHHNIEQMIYELEDNEENRILKNYFNLLVSTKTIKIPSPAKKYKGISFKEGEAELFLLNGEDLNRRVLMTRKTGMRIFEQKNISGSISFTGLLMITGTEMNNIFKQMENPAHTEWAPERYEKDPKLAKTIYADLRKFIRDTVKNTFQEKITDEMDAVGLSDFLPNQDVSSASSTSKSESLSSTIKAIITKQKEPDAPSKPSKKIKGQDSEGIEKQLAGEYGISPAGDKGGNGTGEQGSGEGNDGAGANNPGGEKELDKLQSGEKENRRERKPSTQPVQMKQRYVCVDKANGKYKFNIIPEKTLSFARLVFKVVGEQSDYDLPIKSAATDDGNVTVEKWSSNTVELQSLKKNKSFTVTVDIDYTDYCVLEVELYEN